MMAPDQAGPEGESTLPDRAHPCPRAPVSLGWFLTCRLVTMPEPESSWAGSLGTPQCRGLGHQPHPQDVLTPPFRLPPPHHPLSILNAPCPSSLPGCPPADMGQSGRRPTLTQGASLVAQPIQNPPAIQEPRVRSLGLEDPLEKGTATHSRILAWRIPWTEGPGGLQSMRSQRVGHDWATNTFPFRPSGKKDLSRHRNSTVWYVSSSEMFVLPGSLHVQVSPPCV